MRARYVSVLIGVWWCALQPSPAESQAPPATVPCRAQACGLVVEWGRSGTPEWHDPRYGSASEFPLRVHQTLERAGFMFIEKLADVKLTVILRPEVTNAMCDVVAGTGSRESCHTIGRASSFRAMRCPPASRIFV